MALLYYKFGSWLTTGRSFGPASLCLSASLFCQNSSNHVSVFSVNKTELINVIKALQSNKATEKGLFLNLSKCFIYSPKLPVWASSVKYFDPEAEMEKTVPSGNSGTVVLGTPIGSQEFIDDFIHQEILIPLEKLLENIKLLKDSHTEFFLFRNCATFCKIAFLLRTLPPAQGDFLMKG